MIKIDIILDLETTELELIWLEIVFSYSKNILVCFFYRPPDSKISWLDIRSDHHKNVYDESKVLLLLGDMDINLLKPDENNTQKLMHVLDSVNLVQIIKTPTRVTAKSKTSIDHICTSNPDCFI